MSFILHLLGGLIFSTLSYASSVEELSLYSKNLDRTLSLIVEEDSAEVRVFEKSVIFKKELAAIGKDINSDGFFESWFLFCPQGVKKVELTQKNNLSETISSLFKNHYNGNLHSLSKKTFLSVLGLLLPSVDELYTHHKNFYKQQMEITIALAHYDKLKQTLTRDHQVYILQSILDANELSLKTYQAGFDAHGINTYRDMLIWGTGMRISGLIFKQFGRVGTVAIPATLTRLTWTQVSRNLTLISSSLAARARVYTSLNALRPVLLNTAKRFTKEWKYVALSTGAQTAVETATRFDEVYDPNPAKFAQNIIRHPAIRENVGIGLVQNLMMAGIMTGKEDIRYKFLICGFIGAISSVAVGESLNGEQTEERIWLDSTLAVSDIVIVEADLWLIKNLDKKVFKHSKKHFLGYAVSLGLNLTSYYMYNRMTDQVEKKKEEDVILTPIFVDIEES